MKGDQYGCHRVISPAGYMPQAADKINNQPEPWSNEILIEVSTLQPTATAFGRIKKEFGPDEAAMKAEIMRIVENAGKFQCPVTKSGGMLMGTIAAIGEDLQGKTEGAVGDQISTLVSLSLTPLHLTSIDAIDLDTEQIQVQGQAILFETGIYAKMPADLHQNIALAVLDVAGAPAQVAANVKTGDTVAVIGSGKAGILCLAEAKKRVAPGGQVICLEYSEQQCQAVAELGIADQVIQLDAQQPMAALKRYRAVMGDRMADFTVNTVNVADTELTTILVTKETGLIYFFSMSTNFVKASLGAEGIKRSTRMIIGNGYYPNHAEIAFHILRSNEPVRRYFEKRYMK